MFQRFFYTTDSRCLYREGDKFHTSLQDLQAMLDIAVIYGWRPLGTVNPELDEWEGSSLRSYLVDANQLVTHEDALNLADALSKSLIDNFQKLVGTELDHLLSTLESLSYFTRQEVDFIQQGQFYITNYLFRAL